MRVLLAIPTFDEAENLEEVLSRARAAVPEADILVVDDNSPDGTADLADRLGATLGHVEVLRRPAKQGLGSAYRAAFTVAIARGYDVVCQMDADLSHDPATLPALVAAVAGGADVAIGARYVPGGSIPHWPAHRRALSRYGNLYACRMLRLPVHDATSGFRAYRTAILERIHFETTRATGYGFQIELANRIARSGGGVVEHPISFRDRVRGHSKMSWRIVVEAMGLVTWWGIRDRLRRRR